MKTVPLYGSVQDDLQRVEQVFDDIKQVDYGPLGEMLKMVLGGGGKLMRPGLALLAGRFGQYDLDRLVPLAASVELLHTATLVHDDVIDNADTRRGRPTVNSSFQNSTTVTCSATSSSPTPRTRSSAPTNCAWSSSSRRR